MEVHVVVQLIPGDVHLRAVVLDLGVEAGRPRTGTPVGEAGANLGHLIAKLLQQGARLLAARQFGDRIPVQDNARGNQALQPITTMS